MIGSIQSLNNQFFLLASGSSSSPVVGSPGLESGTSSVPLASPHRLPRSGTPPTTSLLSTGSSVKASPRLERQNSKGSLPLIGKVSPRQATTTPARPALHLPSFRRRGATATSPRTSAAATISTSSKIFPPSLSAHLLILALFFSFFFFFLFFFFLFQ